MKIPLKIFAFLFIVWGLNVTGWAQPETAQPRVYLNLDVSGLKMNNANSTGTLLLSLLQLKSPAYRYRLDTLATSAFDQSFTFFVNGVIYSRNTQIILTFDIKTHADSVIHLPLMFADQKNFYEKLVQATDQILNAFPSFSDNNGKKKINVLVVGKDIWGKSGNRAITRDLLLKISEASPSSNAYLQLVQRNTAMPYDYVDGNQTNLADQLMVDAILGVDVTVTDYPRVRGSLFVREGKREILLPPVYVPGTDAEFLINLRRDFFQLLAHFVDSANYKWRQDSIVQFKKNLDLDVPELTTLSHQYLRQKNYALALLMSYRALEKKSNPTSYFQIGSALRSENRINEARFIGDIGLTSFPDDPPLLLLQGAILMELREFKDAKARVRAAIAKDKDFYLASIPNPFILITRANLFLAEYDSAISNASVYMKVHPHDAEATYYLGKSYFYKGKYAQAITALKSVDTLRLLNRNIASDVKTTLERSYSALTKLKIATGDVDSSRIVLRNSGTFGSNYDLSILYIKEVMRSGHFDQIDSLVGVGVRRKIFNKNIIYYVLGLEAGNVADEKGMTRDAIQALRLRQIEFFTRSLKVNPGDYRSEKQIGVTYLRMGRSKEGIPFLKNALMRDSTLIGNRLDLAEAVLTSGDFKASLQLLNNGQLQATAEMRDKSFYALVLCYRALARIFMEERTIRELDELKKVFAKKVIYGGWEFETLETWMNQHQMSREQSIRAHELLLSMKKLFGK
ncbi:MAG TPA: hypothetical protein PLX35_07990 [Cyclobacteriaceae bacterium]|nr:hypothetical protein [Cyclobacteriaceae bacterium]